jgi:hypothetical protein
VRIVVATVLGEAVDGDRPDRTFTHDPVALTKYLDAAPAARDVKSPARVTHAAPRDRYRHRRLTTIATL